METQRPEAGEEVESTGSAVQEVGREVIEVERARLGK
jgi:hypothetical protein